VVSPIAISSKVTLLICMLCAPVAGSDRENRTERRGKVDPAKRDPHHTQTT